MTFGGKYATRKSTWGIAPGLHSFRRDPILGHGGDLADMDTEQGGRLRVPAYEIAAAALREARVIEVARRDGAHSDRNPWPTTWLAGIKSGPQQPHTRQHHLGGATCQPARPHENRGAYQERYRIEWRRRTYGGHPMLDSLMSDLAKAREVEKAAAMDVCDRADDHRLTKHNLARAERAYNAAKAEADRIEDEAIALMRLRTGSDLDCAHDYTPTVPCENLGQFQYTGMLEGPE